MPRAGVWRIAAAQHGVVARRQLLEAGLTSKAIKHRLERGRLHRVERGVYAVGRPQLTQHARWMAAVLACGPSGVLSDESAAALWKIRPRPQTAIEVTIPSERCRAPKGILIHRRALAVEDIVRRDGIPVTGPTQTLVHLASRIDRRALEAAVNQADKLGLVDSDTLRRSLSRFAGRAGVAALRGILDRNAFTLTDSELERRFLPLVRHAGLPTPLTGRRVNGFKVDFYWRDLGLVVETDGLTYHRTPAHRLVTGYATNATPPAGWSRSGSRTRRSSMSRNM